ncbi:MAG: glycoside hydrolase family 5 protein, partial [Janthinobacterium lividum]
MSPVLTQTLPSVTSFFVGANITDLASGSVFPGVAGTDYGVPKQTDITYLASRGEKVIRLPVFWERLQPTLNGALDPAYLSYITSAATYASSVGSGIILDVHNYGGYSNAGTLGSTGLPYTAFADLWARISTALVNQAGVIGYDLMNEPISLGSNLQPAMQAAITAIRAKDTSHRIFVEGDGYSGTGSWTSYSENAALYTLTDPSGLLTYEGHMYNDCDNSGTHSNWALQSTDPSLDKTGTTCTSAQAVTVTTGVDRLKPFVGWCSTHAVSCMIGENGVGSDPSWITAEDNNLAYLKANNIGEIYFTAGGFYSAYAFGIEPQSTGQQPGNVIDTPQQGALEHYSGVNNSVYGVSGPTYGTSGAVSTAFTITVHGYIAAATTITPNDNSAGGTFSPASTTLPVGDNASATFTYTAPGAALYKISFTNNQGWTNPASVGYSTRVDLLKEVAAGSGATPVNILSLRCVNTAWVNPIVNLRRDSD